MHFVQSYKEFKWRPVLLILLLVIEVVLITTYFYIPVYFRHVHDNFAIKVLMGSTEYWRIALWIVGSALFVLSPQYKPLSIQWILETRSYPWKKWLNFHFIALVFFVALTEYIINGITVASELTLVTVIVWIGLAGATFYLWLMALMPYDFCLSLLKTRWLSLIGGCLLGVYGWFVYGMLFSLGTPLLQDSLWQFMSGQTLSLSYWLLSGIYSSLYKEPDSLLLSTDSFAVIISHHCSGIEGIILISIFLTLYFWLFRDRLRFPHVFLLYPIGMGVIWLANGVRIAMLVAIGSSYSSQIAQDGFHAQAGWIVFTLLSLLIISVTHKLRFFGAVKDRSQPAEDHSALAIALLVPLLIQLGFSMISAALTADFDHFYPVKIIVVSLALVAFYKQYQAFEWSWSWVAMVNGALVFMVWIAIIGIDDAKSHEMQSAFERQPAIMAWLWLAFRVVGSSLVVPIAEELAFRGYLLRKIIANDFENVAVGRFTWLSFVSSSLCFGFLHGNWMAGTLAGMAYCLALYHRKQLCDAVLAHMTTNLLISLSVIFGGNWSLWA